MELGLKKWFNTIIKNYSLKIEQHKSDGEVFTNEAGIIIDREVSRLEKDSYVTLSKNRRNPKLPHGDVVINIPIEYWKSIIDDLLNLKYVITTGYGSILLRDESLNGGSLLKSEQVECDITYILRLDENKICISIYDSDKSDNYSTYDKQRFEIPYKSQLNQSLFFNAFLKR